MHTTLNKIRSHDPCHDGWKKLLKHLKKTKADDATLPIMTVLDSNGLDDALWCLRAVDGHEKEMRLYAVWCARQVQHLTADPRGAAALDVAEKFAEGNATADELEAASEAAWAAARGAAWAAAWKAARAAAWEAARAAARGAARGAAWAAASEAAWGAASEAAWAAAREAAWAAQEARLRQVLSEATTT